MLKAGTIFLMNYANQEFAMTMLEIRSSGMGGYTEVLYMLQTHTRIYVVPPSILRTLVGFLDSGRCRFHTR